MKKTASCILLICGTLVMYLTGCGKSISQQEALSKSSEESYVTLKALTIGVPPEDGMDQYYEELDKKTEELGCHLRFDYIPWGDERSQINMAISSSRNCKTYLWKRCRSEQNGSGTGYICRKLEW